MSIEASRHLNPFIKAKLQEHGIISLEQLGVLLRGVRDSSTVNKLYSHISAEAALRKVIPSLTDREARALLQVNLLSETHSGVLSKEPQKVNEEKPSSSVSNLPIQFQSLADLRNQERKRQRRGERARATTFCRSLDELLEGGVPLGEVTEISGPPGAGKTQMLMQLAVSCTLPIVMGGLGGSCIYLDTEGSFVPERFYQIVSAAVSLIANIAYSKKLPPMDVHSASEKRSGRKREREEEEEGTIEKMSSSSSSVLTGKTSKLSRFLSDFTVEYVLKHVHYCRVSDVTMLMAILHSLPDLLGDKSTGSVKMVVLDSVAMPFRSLEGVFLSDSNASEMQAEPTHSSATSYQRKEAAGKRSRLIFMCSQLLYSHAVDHNLAVVVSNHVASRTLRISNEGNRSNYSCFSTSRNLPGITFASALLPALGESWGFGLSRRIVLSHQHHNLPFDLTMRDSTGESTVFECPNAAQSGGTPTLSQEQHRVARLVKGSPAGCKEACFAITRKGIRDWTTKK